VDDSNIPIILSTSGTFNDISLSSTLNPYISLFVKPLVEVFIPDEVLFIISEEHLLYIFFLEETLIFLNVTVKVEELEFGVIP